MAIRARKRVGVKRWLRATKRTQAGWADELGVDHMTVWLWLNKGVAPSPMAQALIDGRTPESPLATKREL